MIHLLIKELRQTNWFTCPVLLIAFTLLIGQKAVGQTTIKDQLNAQADSLVRLLTSATAEKKASIQTKLAELAVSNDLLDSALSLSNKAEFQFIKTSNNDELLNHYLSMAGILGSMGFRDECLNFCWKAHGLSKKYSFTVIQKWTLFNSVGYWYSSLEAHDSSKMFHRKSIAIAPPGSVYEGLGWLNLGNAHSATDELASALKYYLEAAKLFRQLKHEKNLATVYSNIGDIYHNDGSIEQASVYYLKALSAAKKTTSLFHMFFVSTSLGDNYVSQHKYDSSYFYLLKAGEISRETPLPTVQLAYYYRAMGNYYYAIKRLDDAIVWHKKSFKELPFLGGCALGFDYLAKGDLKNAKDAATKAFFLVKKSNYFLRDKALVNNVLTKIFEAEGNYMEAYKYSTQQLALKDSIAANDHKQFLLVEKEYDLAKVEEEKKSLAQQARIDTITRNALWVGLGFLVLAGLVTGYLLNLSRSKNKLLQLANNTILKQSDELQKASELKSRFFANVSHELRTPVTLITGLLEQLIPDLRQPNNPKMAIALDNSRRLRALLDEVLDLTRADVTQPSLKRKEKEILPLLTRIVFAFESLLTKKNIQLNFNASVLAGSKLAVDEDKFEKIINNLMLNAFKFSHTNSTITVEGSLSNNNQEEVIIRVKDTGIGINARDLPHIFERFYQSSTGKTSGGVGIGLSLVKEYTELHGGSVSVNSTEGKGTVFELKFPGVAPSLVSTIDVEPALPEDALPTVSFASFNKTPVILFVEDNEDMQFYLTELFEGQASVACAINGQQALEWLSSNTADLIISDLMMPVMDGYELLKELKSSENLKHIPVIMLTARGADEDKLQGLSLGVDDYITKPFLAQELKIRVYNLLVNVQMRKQWLEKPLESDEATERMPNVMSSEQAREFLQKVEAFVIGHSRDASLTTLADHLATSERQLNRTCGLLTGMTPAQLIKEVRLKKAYQLLTSKSVTKITELAFELGFQNVAYFSRQFLDRYGKRPLEML